MKTLINGFVEFDAAIKQNWEQKGIQEVIFETVDGEMYDYFVEPAFRIIPGAGNVDDDVEAHVLSSEYLDECASGADKEIKFIVHESDL